MVEDGGLQAAAHLGSVDGGVNARRRELGGGSLDVGDEGAAVFAVVQAQAPQHTLVALQALGLPLDSEAAGRRTGGQRQGLVPLVGRAATVRTGHKRAPRAFAAPVVTV